jgi:hypothetical protein
VKEYYLLDNQEEVRYSMIDVDGINSYLNLEEMENSTSLEFYPIVK